MSENLYTINYRKRVTLAQYRAYWARRVAEMRRRGDLVIPVPYVNNHMEDTSEMVR